MFPKLMLTPSYSGDFAPLITSGDERARTAGLLRAREALSQLSYIPLLPVKVGLCGLEPQTFPLSEGCSNQLS